MVAMRIAVATSDGRSVCDHLARSSSFVVFEVEGGRVAGRSVRERGSDACGNHRTFVGILAECDAVLCGGIGQGAVDSLLAGGIRPLVLRERLSIEDALAKYLAGQLATSDERVCLCGPTHTHAEET